MDISNSTRLSVLSFEQYDRERRERTVVLARGSYQLRADADPVELEIPLPFVLVDEAYGEPQSSSLRRASELCYAKPRTDLFFLDPRAVAPGGRATASWPVTVRIGRSTTRLEVTGRRVWSRSALGFWRLEQPEPCEAVDIRYELAYGGSWEGEKGRCIYAENPVGLGHVAPEMLAGREDIPAPRIQDPQQPPTLPNQPCAVVGLTPVSPGWQPRLGKAGTYDKRWLEQDWPHLPADFDEAFFNAAPLVLQYPGHIAGGEAVVVTGMAPGGPLEFRLPRFGRLVLHTYAMNGTRNDHVLQADCVTLDLERRTVEIVWRTSFVPPATVFFAQLRWLDET
jgi:hypothetical protein